MITVYLNKQCINVIKRDLDLHMSYMTEFVAPLNKRIESFDMVVGFDGYDFLLFSRSSEPTTGSKIHLDDVSLKHLMAMSDPNLNTFLTGF